MIRDLIPWTQLTRNGIPEMQVARRPMTIGEITIPVGQVMDAELFRAGIRRARLRQFYESRLLEPVLAPKGSRQAHRPSAPITSGQAGVRATSPPLSLPLSVTPTSRVTTSAAVIPSVDIPISEPSSSTYVPPRHTGKAKGVR